MILFTPNHPNGGRFRLYVKERLTLSDDWSRATVYTSDDTTKRGVRVYVRKADCGLGCRCAADLRYPLPARLRKADKFD